MNFPLAQSVANDRLVAILFCATVFHAGLILGISFDGGLVATSQAAPALDVVILQSVLHTEEPDEHANFVATANSQGAGDTRERVAPASRGADGASADAPRNQEQTQPDRVVLSATSVVGEPRQRDTEMREFALSFEQQLSDVYDETRTHGDRPRERAVSVNTRESNIAGYLAKWKRKVEHVGTLNFPALRGFEAKALHPVIEVAVSADGKLFDVVLRRSSDIHAVDEAALRILEIAAPFEPFPTALQDEYDTLRFVYEWQFIEGAPVRVSQHAGAPRPVLGAAAIARP